MADSTRQRRLQRPPIEVVDAKVAVDLATAQTYSENVFLFVPNLIGAQVRDQSNSDTDLVRRIYTRHSGGVVAPFHELSSKVLYTRVCRVVSFGRSGRTSGPCVGPNVEIRSGVGHGY